MKKFAQKIKKIAISRTERTRRKPKLGKKLAIEKALENI
jgi:hypothetical protein